MTTTVALDTVVATIETSVLNAIRNNTNIDDIDRQRILDRLRVTFGATKFTTLEKITLVNDDPLINQLKEQGWEFVEEAINLMPSGNIRAGVVLRKLGVFIT